MTRYDVAVVGGGIVGLATAMALLESGRRSLVALEAEAALARHQSGRSSGVIHSGLYYRPGSLKARTCIAGRRALYAFCAEHGVPVARCGKLVVAADDGELEALAQLQERARGNGLEGIERLDPAGIRAREPHARGAGGLWVPQTGVVDFARVVRAMAGVVVAAGGEVRTGARLKAVRRQAGGLRLHTTAGIVRCAVLVACAGLQSDRVARLCGLRPALRIVPFRGEYYEVAGERRDLVRGLIYPVPDPRLPFLGVHLSRTIDGRLKAGPNAVLALARQGYGRLSASPRDVLSILTFPGFWRLARRHARSGVDELRRSWSKRRFAAAVARLVPAIRPPDLVRSSCGIRAQAVDAAGRLIDDFRIAAGPRSLHVLNAPSPAATASIAIGREVAGRALALLDR
ncbi:MAG: L-2-hydroxyglutarate oxidase [Acidobacteria bacterium]|nr:MAG: L-2-hydroxyglutarate oxidase [Acidobacteriota bacterium]